MKHSGSRFCALICRLDSYLFCFVKFSLILLGCLMFIFLFTSRLSKKSLTDFNNQIVFRRIPNPTRPIAVELRQRKKNSDRELKTQKKYRKKIQRMAAPQPVIVQPGAPQQFVQPPPGAAPPGAPGNSCLLGYHFVHQTGAGTRAGGGAGAVQSLGRGCGTQTARKPI